MRKIIFPFIKAMGMLLLVFHINFIFAQEKIVQVGLGEYSTVYRTDAGKLYTAEFSGNTYIMKDIGLSNIIDVDGAQYTNVALDSNGKVYIVGINRTTRIIFNTPIPSDNLGDTFTGNTKVYGWYQGYLSLRNGEIWMWGQDLLNVNGGNNINAPIKLVQPAGKTIKKLAVSTQGAYNILALATDGTVWRYTKGIAFLPLQIFFPSPAIDIAAVGAAACLVETSTDLYGWGYYGSYVGATNFSNVPVSVKAKWTAAGCVFPTKQLVGNYNTLHIIDQNNNMFASGSNPQAEIGNGLENPAWRTNTPMPWQWSFANGQFVTLPVQIPGKFKNICTSNTITFYHYSQDLGDNWYSWGRNKSRSLGNGVTLSANNESDYPEFRNVTAPTLVTPLTTPWTIVPFNPNGPQEPMANAGVNQYISSDTTILYGQGSSQQEGTLTSYAWTKISGPNAIIATPTLKNTNISGLTNGTYIFGLTVTNALGATASSTVTVVVTSVPPQPNQAPTANAGSNISITLPVNTTALMGSGTDADGTIASYAWVKLTGTGGTLTNANAATATAGSLTQGIYTYQLTVTDNAGATGKDTVQVTVNAALPPPPQPNQAPTANAGSNISITLPVNTTALMGSGTDADGTIASYAWVKLTGTGGTLTNANTAMATAGSLTQGIYTYQLTVTDNAGATGKDTVQVTVNAALPPPPQPNQAPTANAGSNISITLPINTTALSGSGTDADGTIASYAWVKLTGSGGTLTNANAATATAGSLTQGIYTYQLTVTDNAGATGKDTVQVTVNAALPPPPQPNQAPTANAGSNISITLPINTTALSGSGTDADGTIASYAWVKLTGSGGTLTNANAATATAGSLTQGIYTYQLTVTDNAGATGKDTVQVTVNAALPPPPPQNKLPIADAGADVSIYLPLNLTALNGSATDPDGSIISYSWKVISGPAQYSFVNASNAVTGFSQLVQGVYGLELTVTDNAGGKSADTMTVSVGSSRSQGFENNVKIYPNPVQNYLTAEITVDGLETNTLVQLYDIKGVLVLKKQFKVNNFAIEKIDMSTLKSGVYILYMIFDDQTKITKKIIKN